jgi:hypothetical protein
MSQEVEGTATVCAVFATLYGTQKGTINLDIIAVPQCYEGQRFRVYQCDMATCVSDKPTTTRIDARRAVRTTADRYTPKLMNSR